MSHTDQHRRLLVISWVPYLAAILGGLVYFAQTIFYAHTRDSILDEGAYLYKGLLFVEGIYTPYQDYGPWSNHMPLAFYIPGIAQRLFGPGVRTGRYLAILTGILFLLGVWILARRLGGRWWAAGAVWAIAVNPAMIKMYSVYVSQVLIACMLVWTLVLVLGEGRTLLQIALGSALASLILLTRINMAPLIPLLVLYVFWQHGIRAGILALLASGLTTLAGHAFFWPGILRVWAYWLPRSLTPFLEAWRYPIDAYPSWDPEVSLSGRVASFFMSFRVSFLAMVGAAGSVMLWPRKEDWKKASDRRGAVLLAASSFALLGVHMWATLTKNYCVYCLPGYTTFFSVCGLLLVVLTAPIWRKQNPWAYSMLLTLVVLLICTGVGYGAWDDLAKPLYELPVPRFFLGYPLSAGSVELGELVSTLSPIGPRLLRRLLPMVAGFTVGVMVLLLALGIKVWDAIRYNWGRISYGYLSITLLVILGTVFTPSLPLAGGYEFLECSGDTIRANEAAGRHLARLIPPGSQVYWRGGLSAVPLLYVPDIQIYAPQINGTYTFYENGDSDALLRYGFWNKELAQQWAHEADYLLIQPRFFQGWLKGIVTSDRYEELEPSPPTAACRDASEIRIFRRNP